MPGTIAEPRNARSRRSRAALLDATRELITEGGFDALTMGAVADRARMTRRSVYLHFTTRAELVGELFGRLDDAEEVWESVQRVWDSPDSVTALAEWGQQVARVHARILPVVQAADRARQSDPDAEQLWQAGQGRWQRGARRLAAWLADEDQLAPPWTPASAADMIWALMSPDLLGRLLHDLCWTPERAGDHLAALLTATFAADGVLARPAWGRQRVLRPA